MSNNLKNQRSLFLTERDLDLFKYIFEAKIVNLRQIQRDIFQNISSKTVHRRVLKLLKAGYLESKGVSINSKLQFVYRVTDKAVSRIQEKSKFTIDREILKSDSIEHDLRLNDIRHTFMSLSSCTQYLSENALNCYKEVRERDCFRCFTELRADGALNFNLKNESVWSSLEYDRFSKDLSRYRQKIKDYYDQEEIKNVLYLCEKSSIMNALLKIDSDICKYHDSKFFFSTTEEFLLSKGEVFFVNHEGTKIAFN